jgi:hypothetical protein
MPRLRLLARLLCWLVLLLPVVWDASGPESRLQSLQAPVALLALAEFTYLLPLGLMG